MAVLYKLCVIFPSLKTIFLFKFVIIVFFSKSSLSRFLVNWIFSVLETGNKKEVIFLLFDWSIVIFINQYFFIVVKCGASNSN